MALMCRHTPAVYDATREPDWELPLEQPVQGQGLCGPQMDPEPPTGSPHAPREHASSGQ